MTLKIICCCNTAKILSELTKNFPANMSLFGVRKKHLHSIVSWRPKLHSWSTLKANVRLFLYISVRKDVVRFYLIGGGLGGSSIISLRRLVFWASLNVLQLFILIEIFVNSTIQHFGTFIYSLKIMKFYRLFGLRV